MLCKALVQGKAVLLCLLLWLKLLLLMGNTNSPSPPEEILTKVSALDGAVVEGDA